MPNIASNVPYYGGTQVANPANIINLSGSNVPGTNVAGLVPGTLAVNNQNQLIYALVSKTGNTGTWAVLGGASGAISAVNGTANQITANTVANVVTLSLPSAITAPGSVTATTTLTATAGAITATNGNLVLGTAGNKIMSTSVASTTTAGANSFGKVTLVSGTATIATTAITASSIVILTRQSPGSTGAAALGQLSIGTISAGVSFVINALTTADSTAVATTDVSSIGWMIIN